MPILFRSSDAQSIRQLTGPIHCVRFALLLSLLMVFGTVLGCVADNRYREQHDIERLQVVFVDQQTLHQEWKVRTGRDGVQILPSHGGSMPSIKTLKGFFDFSTNTLYCPKWNFSVCGHELHHAVLGHFHDKE